MPRIKFPSTTSLLMSLRLLRLDFINIKNRLAQNLAGELVTAISALAIIALFIYITHDFLSIELKKLHDQTNLWRSLNKNFSYFILAMTSISLGWRLGSRFKAKGSIENFAYFIGNAPQTIQTYRHLSILILSIMFYSFAWFFIEKLLIPYTYLEFITANILMLAMSFTSYYINQRQKNSPAASIKNPVNFLSKNTLISPVKWRFIQVYRNKVQWSVSAVLAAYLYFRLLTLLQQNAPFFLIYLITFLLSILLVVPIAYQLRRDVEISWLEKTFGMSHDRFISTYNRISIVLSLILASILVATLFCFEVYSLDGRNFDLIFLNQTAQIIALVCGLAAFYPSIMFQIDSRKPLLQLISLFLFGLLYMTLIFIHWGFVIIIPILKSYADSMQKDRYYRA
ncbi:MAG: hypothetical protein KBD78_07495 [Oligoflexales bacterium]|nr:hypothetical protein [Oligoflexales bacterium]